MKHLIEQLESLTERTSVQWDHFVDGSTPILVLGKGAWSLVVSVDKARVKYKKANKVQKSERSVPFTADVYLDVKLLPPSKYTDWPEAKAEIHVGLEGARPTGPDPDPYGGFSEPRDWPYARLVKYSYGNSYHGGSSKARSLLGLINGMLGLERYQRDAEDFSRIMRAPWSAKPGQVLYEVKTPGTLESTLSMRDAFVGRGETPEFTGEMYWTIDEVGQFGAPSVRWRVEGLDSRGQLELGGHIKDAGLDKRKYKLILAKALQKVPGYWDAMRSNLPRGG